MQESVSMHKSHTPLRHSRMNQARWEEEEKERKRDRKDRGQEADGKKAAQQNKYISEELKEESGGRNPKLPLATEYDSLLPLATTK